MERANYSNKVGNRRRKFRGWLKVCCNPIDVERRTVVVDDNSSRFDVLAVTFRQGDVCPSTVSEEEWIGGWPTEHQWPRRYTGSLEMIRSITNSGCFDFSVIFPDRGNKVLFESEFFSSRVDFSVRTG